MFSSRLSKCLRLSDCTQETVKDAARMVDDPIVDIGSSALRDDGE